MLRPQPPCPTRRRCIRVCTFGWIDHRLLTEGYLAQLSAEALRLYVFLVLVADVNGVSWYSYDRICERLQITVESYVAARDELVQRALVAYAKGVFQVLTFPTGVAHAPPNAGAPVRDMQRHHDFQTLQEILSHVIRNAERS